MNTTSLHPTPSTRTVAIEQFRAVGVAVRREGYFYVGALVLFAVLAISAAVRATTMHHGGNDMGVGFSATGAIPIIMVALLAPFAVWRSEDPARRAYHWSMPVARGPHTLLKLLSGWAWLMLAAIVYLLFIVLLATIVPAISGQAMRLGDTAGWEWLVIFTGPTLAYLLISIAVIGSDHAWRWIGGVVFGYWILIAFLWILGMPEASRMMHAITGGTFGMHAAFFGAVPDAVRSNNLQIGMQQAMQHEFSMAIWLMAMPIWIVGAGVAAAVASYRRPD